jgi:Helix-turn-helix domain
VRNNSAHGDSQRAYGLLRLLSDHARLPLPRKESVMDRLLLREEAAELLRKPTSWLRYAERHHLLPYVKVGQHVRYSLQDLLTWVESAKVTAKREGR